MGGFWVGWANQLRQNLGVEMGWPWMAMDGANTHDNFQLSLGAWASWSECPQLSQLDYGKLTVLQLELDLLFLTAANTKPFQRSFSSGSARVFPVWTFQSGIFGNLWPAWGAMTSAQSRSPWKVSAKSTVAAVVSQHGGSKCEEVLSCGLRKGASTIIMSSFSSISASSLQNLNPWWSQY
jgi:hypothetical protein